MPSNGTAAENARARRALAKLPVSANRCGVPGCGVGRITEDCCYFHSLQNSDTESTIPNDGIIDWVAIKVAVQGARTVRLTWVEKDIALAMILARGGSFYEAAKLLGVTTCATRRIVAAAQIREALADAV